MASARQDSVAITLIGPYTKDIIAGDDEACIGSFLEHALRQRLKNVMPFDALKSRHHRHHLRLSSDADLAPQGRRAKLWMKALECLHRRR